MAQVTRDTCAEIDRLLDRLWERWSELPQVAAEIDSWDLLDQLHFTEEWPLETDCLLRLERYVADDGLTPEQLVRYHDLKALIERHRPILQAIMDGSPTIV